MNNFDTTNQPHFEVITRYEKSKSILKQYDLNIVTTNRGFTITDKCNEPLQEFTCMFNLYAFCLGFNASQNRKN